jgi:hypothetical protein
MDQEKNTETTPAQEPYVPASKGKRIAAWVGVVLMVVLILLYTYSLATGSFLLW